MPELRHYGVHLVTQTGSIAQLPDRITNVYTVVLTCIFRTQYIVLFLIALLLALFTEEKQKFLSKLQHTDNH